ncbi:MAG: cytochrome ubiquinol oxidase subunit I [Capsulimonadaceae bacterium]|nr:cytochrome ubiquinol oxidase subunit I [Capsulimonadaceae bacterium]
MDGAVIANRTHFAVLIMFHYIFPALTMGLSVMIAVLKSFHYFRKDERYGRAARFWARIFLLNFGAGVASGVPMEFQFGTNWARFADASGGVIGPGLMMEGVYAFFLESAFLGVFIFGEKKVSPFVHWLSAVLLAFGTLLSGYFITVTDSFMQHPVAGAFAVAPNGKYVLTNLGAYLTNPYELWMYLHTISGSLITGAMVVAALGAFYALSRKHDEFARICLKAGVIAGLIFSVLTLFPTGAKNGEQVVATNPAKLAAMEGQFRTEPGAPLALIGMPDVTKGELLDPIYVPELLSYLAYGSPTAPVRGLDDIPKADQPPIEVTYYAYHIMIGLGMAFVAILGIGTLLLILGKLQTSRWFLWLLMLAFPFPYIANEAGWCVAEVGRQPWLIYGAMRTTQGYSANVSTGEVLFTLIGFVGLYIVLGITFLILVGKIIAQGPDAAHDATGDAPALSGEEA